MALMALCALVACSRPSDDGSARSERVGTTSSALTSYVQSNYLNRTTVRGTYTAAQSAGDLNVVVVGWAASGASVTGVTDAAGNTYTLAVGPLSVTDSDDSGVLVQSIYYAKNIAASAANANVVTVSFNQVTTVFVDVRLLEYSGVNTTSPLDVTVQSTGTHSTTASTGSVTTTNASDLLVAASMTEEPSGNGRERLHQA